MPIYGVARTVADCFRFRNTVGLDVALEALTDAWRSQRLNVNDLNRIAKKLRLTHDVEPVAYGPLGATREHAFARKEALMRIPLPTVAALCFIAGLARPVAAEPITVTSGVVSISDVTSPAWGFSLTGFDFQAYGAGPTPTTTGFSTCALSSCLGGTTLNLGGSISPVNAVGWAKVDGTMYPNTQYPGGLLVFTTGDVVVPPASDPRQFPILSSQFAFTGTLDIAAAGPDGVFPVGSVELAGVGNATGFFSKTETGYRLEGITYDFINPTPEPGSLLLLATGAVMALRRVRTAH